MLLPEFRNPDAGRIDLWSVVLSLLAVFAAIYGLKQIAQDGVDWLPSLSIVAGVFLGVVFVHRQRTLADPMLDLDLFRIRAFSACLAAYGLSFGVMFGAYVFVLQHLQLVLGYSPLGAGAWMVPSGIGFLLAGMLTPLLAKRFRPGFVMAAGLALSSISFAALTQVDERSATAFVAFAFAIFAFGVTPVFTLATDLIVGAAPRERAGVASGISETGAEFGGALGIAVFGSIGVAVYRGRLADGLPAGVPPEQAEVARDTLGGANEVAGQLPDSLGTSLLESARDAFTAGLQVTAVTGALLLAALAVLLAILLRDVRPAAEAEPELETAGVPVPAS